MTNGKKYGLITALGLASGIIVHTTLVAFGVSAMIRESQWFFLLIRFLGAGYLLFLAFKVIRSAPDLAYSREGVKKRRLWSLYRQGLLMNVLNPKVTIFFLAFFPGFLWDPFGNTVWQFYLLGGLFLLQTILVFGMVALMAGRISLYLKRHRHAGVVLKWVQVLVLMGIAAFVLW